MRNDLRSLRSNRPDAGDAPIVDPRSPRGIALSFTEGVRVGWRMADLASWIRTSVFEGGFLSLEKPGSMRVRIVEPRAGELVIPLAGELFSKTSEPTSRVIVETARARALDVLLAMKEPPRDDRFVNASLYAGRVARVTKDGAPRWTAVMREGDALSIWLLSLFAADALEDREAYDRHLGICQECGAVDFTPGADRRRCVKHAEKASPASGVRKISLLT
jgi:hypothetical protein